MVTRKPKHILIAPLDWGLGHTTRCVPLIRHLLLLGHVPVVAGCPWQLSYIQQVFPGVGTIRLAGYNVTYSRINKWAQAGLLAQLPRISKAIAAEHTWLQQLAAARPIDGIISDNRYGLHHPHIPCVILTHQLQVLTGLGSFPDRTMQKAHYKYLGRFSDTWVVDAPGIPNLAGILSHPPVLPPHCRYIGLLSGLSEDNVERTVQPGHPLVVLLSGPEPQRTQLSRLLWQQVQAHNSNVTFIEGSMEAVPPSSIPPHITYHPRLAGHDLASVLAGAGMVICRSGYSTLMDLAALGRKAILIPTPGQTEQLYLARHLHSRGIMYATPQDSFDLTHSLHEAQQFPYHHMQLHDTFSLHKRVLDDWITSL